MAKEQLAEAESRQDSGDAGQKEMSLKTKALEKPQSRGRAFAAGALSERWELSLPLGSCSPRESLHSSCGANK